jgi:hypothetical protein
LEEHLRWRSNFGKSPFTSRFMAAMHLLPHCQFFRAKAVPGRFESGGFPDG